MFQDEVVGQVLRVARGRLAEAQFQLDGTAVYGGDFIDRVGHWRPWADAYCAHYPSLGAGPGPTPPFSGPVEPDGPYVGTLVPVR